MYSGIKESNTIDDTIKLLSDRKHGDEAYNKIFEIGLPAIPFLIRNSSNMTPFEGSRVYNIASSLLVEKPTVGLVSLYLIDCIIMDNESPHLAPLIITDKIVFKNHTDELPNTNIQVIKDATAYYEKWWNNVKALKKSQIPKISPLAETELRWYGM